MINELRRVDEVQNEKYKQNEIAIKVANCYNRVKKFVDIEIEKGSSIPDAVEIVFNNKCLTKICPDLKDEHVKRKLRSLILSILINSNKKLPEQGDER